MWILTHNMSLLEIFTIIYLVVLDFLCNLIVIQHIVNEYIE